MSEFLVARNPEPGSSLPYLIRLPLASGAVMLKTKDTWPRTQKVYCHPANSWPPVDEVEVIERIPVRSCTRRGAAIDLILDRARENRSQFVFTQAKGRQVVFWQSARTRKQARPNVSVPTARASGRSIEIVVDTRERYAWKFSKQQADTRKQALPAGDYAVQHNGAPVAVVERKTTQDLVSTMVGGNLWPLLAALCDVDHAAVVVEDRYSSVFKLDYVRPSTITEQLAEASVRYPSVPIVFAETRQLAEEWTYRFLGAALEHHLTDAAAQRLVRELPQGRPEPNPTGPGSSRRSGE